MKKDRITLRTAIGRFEGFEDSDGIQSFLGIRYAKPLTARRRWMPPDDVDVFDGCQGGSFGAMPIQRFGPSTYYSGAARKAENFSCPEKIEEMSEDCLFLNIWAHKGDADRRPVLLWIYGGSYLNGSGASPETEGAELVKSFPDIIVVSINYRLGVLGNLDLSQISGSDGRPGRNLALMDQQSAMRWVQRNIGYFGGDPGNVTLCGHSAGSNGISHHLTSEESVKYFHKAICQSSFFPGNGYTTLDDSRFAGDRFLELSGRTNMEELLAMSPEELLNIQDGMLKTDWGKRKSKLFSPVADGETLPVDGCSMLKRGFASDKPVMLGCSQGEYDQIYENIRNPEDAAEQLLRRNRQLENTEQIHKLTGQLKKLGSEEDERILLMDIQNELNMRIPCIRLAQALTGNGRCFLYYVNWWVPQRRTAERSPHGVLNGILFGTMYKDVGKEIRRKVQEAWVSFMRTGNPSGDTFPEWLPYTIENQETMIIDEKWEMKRNWREEEFCLLNSLL